MEQDIRTLRQRLREDSDFDPNYNHIIDLRDVIELESKRPGNPPFLQGPFSASVFAG